MSGTILGVIGHILPCRLLVDDNGFLSGARS